MTVNDTPVGRPEDEGGQGALELLRGGDQWWMLVPTEADGEQRLTNWITVEADLLCDLEEWR